MIVSRPATIEDVRRFYPDVTCSFRAMVAELNGVVEGIVGIALSRPVRSIFCTFTDTLRPHLKSLTVLRLLKWLQGAVAKERLPVLAIREKGEPKAARMLKRLGFVFYGLVDGDAVYKYQNATCPDMRSPTAPSLSPPRQACHGPPNLAVPKHTSARRAVPSLPERAQPKRDSPNQDGPRLACHVSTLQAGRA